MPATSQRLSRTEQRQRTHERLLAAATVLFLENGYTATSVEQIVEVAGYTRGAVQGQFGTKAELADAVLDRLCSRAIAQASMQLVRQMRSAEEIAVGEWMIELVTGWCETAVIERRGWIRLELEVMAERWHDGDADIRRDARLALVRAAVHDHLATAGTGTGIDLAVDADTIVMGLLSVVYGLVIQNEERAAVTASVRPLVRHLLRRNSPVHSRIGQG
ncbi:TetR/AcrR family transcriptional regulator [Nocardia sp. CA-135398]|uniref:TetR/AcrR family transcriptional regulator n=1 Tax=Nocardia sp. CA-135398 TaxID=3239977 RepID=UPI003D95F42A